MAVCYRPKYLKYFEFLCLELMSFFKFEIEHLKKIFPDEKATLENDFENDELLAIDELGILRNMPHLYLGKFSNFLTRDT